MRTRLAVALATGALLTMTACTSSDTTDGGASASPTASQADGVVLNPEALTPSVARQLDPSLTDPSAEVDTEDQQVVAARAPENPTVNVTYSRWAGGTDAADRYASYAAFLEARAGSFEEVDSLSTPWWGYTGYEANGDLFMPLAGVVYVGDGGAVLACEYTGYGQGSAAAAMSLAKDKFEVLRRSCEGAVSGG